MDDSQPKSPLRRVEWLAELLECSPWAANHKIRSKHVPSWCVLRIGAQVRVIEAQVRHWLNGGTEPLPLATEKH